MPTVNNQENTGPVYLEKDVISCHGGAESTIATLIEQNQLLREELRNVLGDWNALVRAIGSPTHGAAVAHAANLRRRVDQLESKLAQIQKTPAAALLSWPADSGPEVRIAPGPIYDLAVPLKVVELIVRPKEDKNDTQ